MVKRQPALVWAALVVYFGLIQRQTDRLAGNDSYYHIKYAYLIWSEGALFDFPWLVGTFFEKVWVDKELLYHLLLVPLTVAFDLHLAAKLAGALFGGTALTAGYLYIRSFAQDEAWRRWAWVWALALACASSGALYRLSCARVPAASAAFMMAALYLLERERPRALGLLAFLYAWMYHVSILLLPLALLHALTALPRPRWRCLGAIAAGLALGFIINPYFPHTIPVLLRHVVQVGLGGTGLPKGNEWSPFDTWTILQVAPVAWLLLLGGLSAALLRGASERRVLFLFLAQALMMAALFKARRFIEYWPLFSVLFFASVVQRLRPRLPRALGLTVILSLVVIAALNARRAVLEISANASPDRLAGATRWLKARTSKGAIVYNAQWDIFPELLFHDHHNRWVTGLDPNFTYFLSPQLYALTQAVETDKLQDMGAALQQAFGAEYALALRGSGFTLAAARPGRGLEQVYEDPEAIVYAVRPVPGRLHLEAELARRQDSLRCSSSTLMERPQDAPSGGAHLRCAVEGTAATLAIPVTVEAGTWQLGLRLARRNRGRVSVAVDGAVVFEGLELSGPGTLAPPVKLPARQLGKGQHVVELRFVVPEGGAVGVDYLEMVRVGEG